MRTRISATVSNDSLDEALSALESLAPSPSGVAQSYRPGTSTTAVAVSLPGDVRKDVATQLRERTELSFEIELVDD